MARAQRPFAALSTVRRIVVHIYAVVRAEREIAAVELYVAERRSNVVVVGCTGYDALFVFLFRYYFHAFEVREFLLAVLDERVPRVRINRDVRERDVRV